MICRAVGPCFTPCFSFLIKTFCRVQGNVRHGIFTACKDATQQENIDCCRSWFVFVPVCAVKMWELFHQPTYWSKVKSRLNTAFVSFNQLKLRHQSLYCVAVEDLNTTQWELDKSHANYELNVLIYLLVVAHSIVLLNVLSTALNWLDSTKHLTNQH